MDSGGAWGTDYGRLFHTHEAHYVCFQNIYTFDMFQSIFSVLWVHFFQVVYWLFLMSAILGFWERIQITETTAVWLILVRLT